MKVNKICMKCNTKKLSFILHLITIHRRILIFSCKGKEKKCIKKRILLQSKGKQFYFYKINKGF